MQINVEEGLESQTEMLEFSQRVESQTTTLPPWLLSYGSKRQNSGKKTHKFFTINIQIFFVYYRSLIVVITFCIKSAKADQIFGEKMENIMKTSTCTKVYLCPVIWRTKNLLEIL